MARTQSTPASNSSRTGVELGGKTAPREVEVPPDFARALDRNARAKKAFEKLPYSHKRQHVLAIEEAKKPETRRRRIEKAVEMLRSGGS